MPGTGTSSGCLRFVGAAFAFGAVLAGWAWVVVERRDGWIPRVEALHAAEVEVMRTLAARAPELGRAPRPGDLEELVERIRRSDSILYADVWGYHRGDSYGSYLVKEGGPGVGSWSLLDRTPAPGETVIDVKHLGGRAFLVYDCCLSHAETPEAHGFTLVFEVSALRAAWHSFGS